MPRTHFCRSLASMSFKHVQCSFTAYSSMLGCPCLLCAAPRYVNCVAFRMWFLCFGQEDAAWVCYGSAAAVVAATVKCVLCAYKRKMVLTCMPYMPVKTHISITYAWICVFLMRFLFATHLVRSFGRPVGIKPPSRPHYSGIASTKCQRTWIFRSASLFSSSLHRVESGERESSSSAIVKYECEAGASTHALSLMLLGRAQWMCDAHFFFQQIFIA